MSSTFDSLAADDQQAVFSVVGRFLRTTSELPKFSAQNNIKLFAKRSQK